MIFSSWSDQVIDVSKHVAAPTVGAAAIGCRLIQMSIIHTLNVIVGVAKNNCAALIGQRWEDGENSTKPRTITMLAGFTNRKIRYFSSRSTYQ